MIQKNPGDYNPDETPDSVYFYGSREKTIQGHLKWGLGSLLLTIILLVSFGQTRELRCQRAPTHSCTVSRYILFHQQVVRQFPVTSLQGAYIEITQGKRNRSSGKTRTVYLRLQQESLWFTSSGSMTQIERKIDEFVQHPTAESVRVISRPWSVFFFSTLLGLLSAAWLLSALIFHLRLERYLGYSPIDGDVQD
ncbi:MAG: hypothetical protein ACO37W_06295 [Prochlorotrichaceae cyanobacterium]